MLETKKTHPPRQVKFINQKHKLGHENLIVAETRIELVTSGL